MAGAVSRELPELRVASLLPKLWGEAPRVPVEKLPGLLIGVLFLPSINHIHHTRHRECVLDIGCLHSPLFHVY